MKPHKHAELIKAWADGAEIQMKNVNGVWIDIYPEWIEDCEYRITPESKLNVPDGLIDPKSYYQGYEDGKNHAEYRIKPEPKPDVEKFFILEANPILGLRLNEIAGFKKQPHEDWIRVVFDGETAKMKSAEVLK